MVRGKVSRLGSQNMLVVHAGAELNLYAVSIITTMKGSGVSLWSSFGSSFGK